MAWTRRAFNKVVGPLAASTGCVVGSNDSASNSTALAMHDAGSKRQEGPSASSKPESQGTTRSTKVASTGDLEWLIDGSRDQVLAAAALHLRGSEDKAVALTDQLWRACAYYLPYTSLGHHLHPLWVIAPIAELEPATDRKLALLHAIDLFKASQSSSFTPSGDFVNPAAFKGQSAAALDQHLRQGWQNGEVELAVQALVELHQMGDYSRLQATCVLFGCQTLSSIGHGAIHVAANLRMVARVGWPAALPALRRMVEISLATREPALHASFTNHSDRVAREHFDCLPGSTDAGQSTKLAMALRDASIEQAAETVVARLRDKVPSNVIWDALRLRSAELALAHRDRPGVFPAFHAMTSVNAYHWLFARADNVASQKIALLQAAAQLAHNRDDARHRSRGDGAFVDLLDLAPAAPSERSLWEIAADDRVAAARLCALRFQGQKDLSAFVQESSRWMLQKASDSHHFKLPIAAVEEARLADPELRGKILAGSFAWGVTSASNDWRAPIAANHLSDSL